MNILLHYVISNYTARCNVAITDMSGKVGRERCWEVPGKVSDITTGDRNSIMQLGRETRRIEKINSDGGVCA
jgi:hypothetical protein